MVVLVLALIALPIGPPALGAAPGVLLSPEVARRDAPPGVKDFVYLKIRTQVDYRGGKLTLASTPDGSGAIVTDDAVTITVRRQKRRPSKPPPKTIDFSQNCLRLQAQPPQEVTDLFRDGKGIYDVTVESAGRVVEEVDPNGGSTRFRYSAAGLLLESIDPTGASTRFTYDDAGHRTSSADPAGAVTTYTYDEASNVTTVRDPEGGTTRYTYDSLGRLLSETDPTGAVTRHRYSADGEMVATVDPLGNETRKTLDARGRPDTFTDKSEAVTRFTYDELDRLVSTAGPDGGRRLEYDGAGRVVAEVDPAAAITRRRWTAAGRLAETEDPLGRVTRYGYDGAGRLTSVAGPGGGVTRFDFDADGRKIATTSPAGLVTRYAYDASGHLVAETSPAGGVTRTEYSARGERVATIAAGGAIRRFRYDPVGRMTAAVDPNGATTLFGYDRAGRMITLTDANGSITRFTRDPSGRETERTDPLGRATRSAYDAVGRLVSTRLATGEAIEFAYDASGRLVSRTAAGSAIRFGYDAAGRRITMEDGQGTTRYAYDAAGRLVTVTGPDGARTATSYDLAGQVTSLQYPSGRQVNFGYDRDGHLTSLAEGVRQPPVTSEGVLPETIAFGRPVEPAPARLVETTQRSRVTAEFEVDRDGRLVKEAFPGGERAYGYEAGRLATLTETLAGTSRPAVTLERDADGRIVAQAVAGRVIRYSYDAAGQLTGVAGEEGGPVSMRYDPAGHRVELATGRATPRFSYDDAGQLVERRVGNAVTTYDYDSAGRLVRDAAAGKILEFTYDAFDRLAARRVVKGGGNTYTFTYDGDDLLTGVGRTIATGAASSESVEHFRWSAGAEVPQILTQAGAAGEADFIYGYGRTAVATPNAAAVFERDIHGSTVVSPDTKSWARAGAYDAFGVPRQALPEARPGPSLGFRGELVIDDDVFLRARTYDPDTGRFISRDPLDGVPGESVVANPYHYAGNDPVNKEDPDGLRPRDIDIDRAFQPPLPPIDFKPIVLPGAARTAGSLLGRAIGGVAGTVAVSIVVDIAFASSAGDPAGDKAAGTVNHLFGQLVGQAAPDRNYRSQDECESRAATDAVRIAAYGPMGVRDIPQPGGNVKRVGKDRTIALAVYCINSRYGTAAAVSGEPPRTNLPGSFNDTPRYLKPLTPREAFDAEIKLLDGLIQRRIASPGAIGVLYMVVDGPTRDVCPSCANVLVQFQDYVGDRLLTIVSSQRQLYINGRLVITSK